MKKKELLESTKIYTADHQKLNFKKDISKFPNLADVLDTAKDCILTGKEYSIFRNSDYDPNILSPHLLLHLIMIIRSEQTPICLSINLLRSAAF